MFSGCGFWGGSGSAAKADAVAFGSLPGECQLGGAFLFQGTQAQVVGVGIQIVETLPDSPEVTGCQAVDRIQPSFFCEVQFRVEHPLEEQLFSGVVQS